MLRGNWGERFTPKLIGLVLAGLLAVSVGFGAILYGFSEQIENDWHSYQRKAEYTKDTYSPAYNSCLSLPANGQADCISKAAKEYRENERDQDDLAAQQTTAVWTFLMGCAAIVGVMLSILGVFLVYTTFSETRKANEIAREASIRQLRPYLHITNASFNLQMSRQQVIDSIHNPQIIPDVALFTVFFKNHGQSTALAVEMWIKCSIEDKRNGMKDFSPDSETVWGNMPPNMEHSQKVSFKDTGRFYESIVAGVHMVLLDGRIEYKDFVGNIYRTDFRYYSTKTHFTGNTYQIAFHGNEAT